jgi:lipoprotein-anchoring transpeptidase ErfK/SrfK
MRRALILTSLLVWALAAPAASAQAPPPPAPAPAPTIRASVLVAGVDLGGLTVPQARTRLREAFRDAYARPVVLSVAGKRFSLRPRQVGFRFDRHATATAALTAGAASPPAADGTVAPVAVAPVARFEADRIGAWIREVRAAVRVAPRDAAIAYSIRRIKRLHSRPGKTLRTGGLKAAIGAALADPVGARVLAPGRRDVPAKVGWEDLPKAYPTVLTIEQKTFRLRLFKRLKLVKTYRVAVGLPAYPTPAGTFAITSKQVNPVWTAPNSPWAGELAGQSVAGGAPTNPLKARWMGLAGGVGIHGTGQPWSIGTRASHGCIRMTVPDVVDLFRRVPLGAPVYIR